MSRKKLYFTVTNDLSYDQRMIRICSSLSRQFEVTLVGRRLNNSVDLQEMSFQQKRIRCLFNRGFLFYAEYNLRLLVWLLFRKADLLCAIDLDTILPCHLISRLKGIVRVYDAHELFCEMKEVVTRPFVHRCWKWIEKTCVPKFTHGYTVNEWIAAEFRKMYGVQYEVIRNLPLLREESEPHYPGDFLLYQGAVNEGRCFEMLIPAMKQVNMPLLICGEGNFLEAVKQFIITHQLQHRVILEGKKTPEELRHYTLRARAGITLFENTGKSNYLSLANRFFDYMHAGIPQVCVDFPAYRQINDRYEVALLVPACDSQQIAQALNRLISDEELQTRLRDNALAAKQVFNWQQEEKTLLQFYEQIFEK